MSGLEVVGLVLASADALVQTCSALLRHVDAKREIPSLLKETKDRVFRIRASVLRYRDGAPGSSIPGDVLKDAKNEFDVINRKLNKLLERRQVTRLQAHAEKVRECNEKLRALEHHLGAIGIMTSLHRKLEELISIIRAQFNLEDEPEISNIINTIQTTLAESENKANERNVVSEQAILLLNAISRSGLREHEKGDLVERALKLWKGWRVNYDDIEFVTDRKGRPKSLGSGASGKVYLAKMKLRDERGEIMSGKFKEIAVKEFAVKRDEEKEQLTSFVREMFLQMDAKHTNIVETIGGYWPDAKELEDGEDIEPFIVMERMTHNLRQVLDMKLLNSVNTKRRILVDIVAGIAHLHGKRIVHRDIKPENVLLRMVDGEIVGPAKVCDFSVSRKSRQTIMATTTMRTSAGLVGTLAYMPPELLGGGSYRHANMTARDIWSLGVLMCEVLESKFLANLVAHHRDGLQSLVPDNKFAKKVAETANTVFINQALGNVAISCLNIDPMKRSRIDVVLKGIENNGEMTSPQLLYFYRYYSREYVTKQVIRCVRLMFTRKSKISNAQSAVAVLERAVQKNNQDVSPRNVLGYCYYFGIGVETNREKAISLFQLGSDAGDATAMYYLGCIYYNDDDIDEAFPHLKSAVEVGCAGAMNYLSDCYRYGVGVEMDTDRAFNLMKCGAEGGDEEAEARITSHIYLGEGTEADPERACSLLHQLSSNGNAFASAKLALWYENGYGGEQDNDKAAHFRRLAKERGISGKWNHSQVWNDWTLSG